MNSKQLQNLLTQAFPNSHIEVINEGNRYAVHIQSELFAGKSPVQRQQMVYRVVNEHIQSGAIHALSIKAEIKE